MSLGYVHREWTVRPIAKSQATMQFFLQARANPTKSGHLRVPAGTLHFGLTFGDWHDFPFR